MAQVEAGEVEAGLQHLTELHRALGAQLIFTQGKVPLLAFWKVSMWLF